MAAVEMDRNSNAKGKRKRKKNKKIEKKTRPIGGCVYTYKKKGTREMICIQDPATLLRKPAAHLHSNNKVNSTGRSEPVSGQLGCTIQSKLFFLLPTTTSAVNRNHQPAPNPRRTRKKEKKRKMDPGKTMFLK